MNEVARTRLAFEIARRRSGSGMIYFIMNDHFTSPYRHVFPFLSGVTVPFQASPSLATHNCVHEYSPFS